MLGHYCQCVSVCARGTRLPSAPISIASFMLYESDLLSRNSELRDGGEGALPGAVQVDPSIPVFGFIGRLEEQKGVDILIEALPAVAAQGGAQVVVLGTGKKALEAAVLQLDKQFPDTVKGVVKFDVPLAHLMTAGERLCHVATSHRW